LRASGRLRCRMALLRPVEGKCGLWHWICYVCGMADRRWYRTPDEALSAARDHAHRPDDLTFLVL
jgi:hypothetical protein